MSSITIQSSLCGTDKLAQATCTEWKKGRYFCAALRGLAARIVSAVDVIIQLFVAVGVVAVSIIHGVKRIKCLQNEWGITQGQAALVALKIAGLALARIVTGVLQAAVSVLLPELLYTVLKTQKIAYKFVILHHLEIQMESKPSDYLVVRNSLRQNFGQYGLDFDPEQFHKQYREIWTRNALNENSQSDMGNWDTVVVTAVPSRTEAMRNYIINQINTLYQLQQISQAEHIFLSQVFINMFNRGGGVLPNVQNLAPMQYSIPRPQQNVTLGKILFDYAKDAAKELVHVRKCFDAEEIGEMGPAPYNAVIALAVFKMISGAKYANNEADITLTAPSEGSLKLDDQIDNLNLKQKFIDLKKMLVKLDAECKKGNKLYQRAQALLMDRLSAPEDAVLDDKEKHKKNIQKLKHIEQELKKLKQDDKAAKEPGASDLQAEIFNKINELVNTLNSKVIQSNNLPAAQTINWGKAFEV